jgi:hypothetical protein
MGSFQSIATPQRQALRHVLALGFAVALGACSAEAPAPPLPPGVYAGSGQGAATGQGGTGGIGGSGGMAGCETGDPCTRDSDCEGGTRCNEEACTRLFCLADGESCSVQDVCESRTCVGGPTGSVCASGSVGDGWSCAALPCESGLSCIASVCRTPGMLQAGNACDATGQCGSGLFCHSESNPCSSVGTCSPPLGDGAECCLETQCATPNTCRRPGSCSTNSSRICGARSAVSESCCEGSDCEIGLICNETTARCEALPVPIPMTTPASLTFSFVRDGAVPAPQSLTLSNTGMGDLDFYVRDDDLLTVTPMDGVIPEGGQRLELEVSVVSTEGWVVGTLMYSLRIEALGARPLDVPITLEVAEP